MKVTETLKKLTEEIEKVLIGKEKESEILLISLLYNGHLLLESVPGTGKTMLAKAFAAIIGGRFSRIQFTPDVLPSDVTGIQFFNPKTHEFELRPGPIVANLVLADEINRATPRTQSSLLEAMEERQVTIDGHTIKLDEPFMVIATQNPVESQQGTFSLPVAQMDRFFMKLNIDYPSLSEEKMMLETHIRKNQFEDINRVLTFEELAQWRLGVKEVKFSAEVKDYLLGIVRTTREHPSIELGVSPRGTLALMKAAQGKAYIQNRSFVTPADIKEMAAPVLAHRIILSTEGSLTKTPEIVLEEIMKEIPVPVESGTPV